MALHTSSHDCARKSLNYFFPVPHCGMSTTEYAKQTDRITSIEYRCADGGGAGGVADDTAAIAIYSGDTMLLNIGARQIVRCVNNFEAVLGALTELFNYEARRSSPDTAWETGMMTRARAAIAAATEGQA